MYSRDPGRVAASIINNDDDLDISVNDLDDLRCNVTSKIYFSPVMLMPCEDIVESYVVVDSAGNQKLNKCPCCSEAITFVTPASLDFNKLLDNALSQNTDLYRDCYFNIEQLAAMLENNHLDTSLGKRMVRLLQHAPNHLNDLSKVDGPHNGKSAIALLAAYANGRQLLLRDEKIRNAISETSKSLIVEGKSIAKSLLLTPRLFNAPYGALFRSVVYADYITTDALLDALKNPRYILLRQSGEEKNGRKWDNISALEFAAWAGDLTETDAGKGMLNLLLQHLPDEYLQEALNQLKAVKETGLELRAMLAPYKQLILDYNTFVRNLTPWTELQTKDYYERVIGCAQKELPLVGLQEICDPEKIFSQQPDFKRAPQRKCKLLNGSDLELTETSSLSNSSALYKGCGPAFLFSIDERKDCWVALSGCVIDRVAIGEFCAEKAASLDKIINELSKRLEQTATSTSSRMRSSRI